LLRKDGPARVLEPEGPLVSDGHERLGDERDEQDDHGDDADEYPPWVEPADVVQRRRMADAEHEDQEAEDEPARIVGAQAEEDEDRRPADVELSAAEEGPRDVPAIQLSRREQVDCGDEEADPTREGERMLSDGSRDREELGEDQEKNGRLWGLSERVSWGRGG